VTYPPPKYFGITGEVSGTLRRSDAPRELPSASYLATGASTGGEFGLYRWDMEPRSGGPGAHFHRRITESFYVLRGRVRLYDGAVWVDGVEDDFLLVPKGGIHAFRNDSDEPASMLILSTPGAPREDYFETLADRARRRAMTSQDWDAFYERHDTYWV
jgi:mannose-6-phosphate isomerase-like protein (cupin superfamily)